MVSLTDTKAAGRRHRGPGYASKAGDRKPDPMFRVILVAPSGNWTPTDHHSIPKDFRRIRCLRTCEFSVAANFAWGFNTQCIADGDPKGCWAVLEAIDPESARDEIRFLQRRVNDRPSLN